MQRCIRWGLVDLVGNGLERVVPDAVFGIDRRFVGIGSLTEFARQIRRRIDPLDDAVGDYVLGTIGGIHDDSHAPFIDNIGLKLDIEFAQANGVNAGRRVHPRLEHEERLGILRLGHGDFTLRLGRLVLIPVKGGLGLCCQGNLFRHEHLNRKTIIRAAARPSADANGKNAAGDSAGRVKNHGPRRGGSADRGRCRWRNTRGRSARLGRRLVQE